MRQTGKKETLLFLVIYPGVEKYLDDCFNSIRNQNTDTFDVLIINDHLNFSFKIDEENWKFIDLPENIAPAEIRLLGLKYAISNEYKYLIFADSDDCFSDNRVALVEAELSKYDFIYNEMDVVHEDKTLFYNFLSTINIDDQYDNISSLIDKNIFGLSNTGVNVDKIKELHIPRDVQAVDWWIFSVLLLDKCVGGFVKGAKTYYRQTEHNFVGIRKELTEDRLKRGIQVKKIHYNALKRYCKLKSFDVECKLFGSKLDEMVQLWNAIQDTAFLNKYINCVNLNLNHIYNGWWSEIIPIYKMQEYANE